MANSRLDHRTAFFYTKQEMGLRMAYWFGFAAVAGASGGLIAFGIQHVHASIANWRLLFLVEVSYCYCWQRERRGFDSPIFIFLFSVKGIPAVLLGIVTLIFLPNRPESTSFFNEKERALALDMMNRSTSGDVGATVNGGLFS